MDLNKNLANNDLNRNLLHTVLNLLDCILF